MPGLSKQKNTSPFQPQALSTPSRARRRRPRSSSKDVSDPRIYSVRCNAYTLKVSDLALIAPGRSHLQSSQTVRDRETDTLPAHVPNPVRPVLLRCSIAGKMIAKGMLQKPWNAATSPIALSLSLFRAHGIVGVGA